MRFKVRPDESLVTGQRPSGTNMAAGLRSLVLLAFLFAMAVPARAGEAPVTLVVLGDSLVAGYGLEAGQAFPEKLGEALRARGYKIDVVNAGVSGDTSAGGLERLDWSVPETATAVIVELGANDALRGLDSATTRKNLDAILSRLDQRGVATVLAGMLAPPNMGPAYEKAFNPIYPELAKKHGALLYPFFLDGVAAQPALNQADGMHPNVAGVDKIVARFLPTAELLLERAKAGGKIEAKAGAKAGTGGN